MPLFTIAMNLIFSSMAQVSFQVMRKPSLRTAIPVTHVPGLKCYQCTRFIPPSYLPLRAGKGIPACAGMTKRTLLREFCIKLLGNQGEKNARSQALISVRGVRFVVAFDRRHCDRPRYRVQCAYDGVACDARPYVP